MSTQFPVPCFHTPLASASVSFAVHVLSRAIGVIAIGRATIRVGTRARASAYLFTSVDKCGTY